MSVAFRRGLTTGPSDLSITVRDSGGNLIDPFKLLYAVYDATTGIEVLVGSPVNTPIKISVGRYYAEVVIPADGNIGDWRIRWTIQETAADPVYQSVQPFNVVGDNAIVSFTGNANMDALIHSLRILLRDNNPDRNYSVSGKEKVTVRIGNKLYSLKLQEIWKIVEDGRNGRLQNLNTKRIIYQALVDKKLEVKSVSKNMKIEWKPITDVTRHDVSSKIQYQVCEKDGKSCTATEDHSLFQVEDGLLKDCRTDEFIVGSPLVCVKGNKIILKKVVSNKRVPSRKYMFDLSVEDNENFVLDSGILAHNSFRPPKSEKFIQGQTQVFGFVWEDEELYEYLTWAVDDFNSRPPTTGIDLSDLWGTERRWRTTIMIRAAAFACFAIALNWIVDEFSISGDEKITVKIGDEEFSLTCKELFETVYEDEISQVRKNTKEAIAFLEQYDRE